MNKIELLQAFDGVAQQLLQLLSSLDEEQLNQEPFPGFWTAGQVGDHLYLSYNIAHILYGSVAECSRPADQKLAGIREAFADFSIKMDAPSEVLPRTGYIEKSGLLAGLRLRLDQQREALQTTDLAKICLEFELPDSGAFTRLEWLGFTVLHTQRHLHQLEQIIAMVNEKKAINHL